MENIHTSHMPESYHLRNEERDLNLDSTVIVLAEVKSMLKEVVEIVNQMMEVIVPPAHKHNIQINTHKKLEIDWVA